MVIQTMNNDIQTITLERESEEFSYLERDYISRVKLCKILNVSYAWIDKYFRDERERMKVRVLTHINKEEKCEVIAVENRYIYIKKDYIKAVFSSFEFYGLADDYETCEKWKRWQRIGSRRIDFEKIIPEAKVRHKGGIREATAIKNGYIKIVAKKTVFFYPNEK